MNVSDRIKAIRKTRGLSQQEVANKIGIDRAQYSRVETGKSEPTITSLTKIAQALEVSVTDFFSEDAAYDIDTYNKSLIERIKLIDQLDEEQKRSLFTFVDLAIANKRLKDTLTGALNLAS